MVLVNALVLALATFKVSIVLVCQVFSAFVSDCGNPAGLATGGAGVIVGIGAMLGTGWGSPTDLGVITGAEFGCGGFAATLGGGAIAGLGLTTGFGMGSSGVTGEIALGAGAGMDGAVGGMIIGTKALLGESCGVTGLGLG
jgi:hypothetical protein